MHRTEEFLEFLAGRDNTLTLDLAALEVAALDHAPVDRAGPLLLLDHWAEAVRKNLGGSSDGARFLAEINRLLFQEVGFQGDVENYHDSANSCLDSVIANRRGMPISLSVLYMEVARRLGRQVEGLALPAHFLCRYSEEGLCVFVDPFHSGRLMTEEDCVELVSEINGQALEFDPRSFPAAGPRLIIHRMINNLRTSYSMQGRIQDVMRISSLQQATWGSQIK
jgi:regulator of sirC expression with transglutaminase-like and TPR domain